LLKTFLNLLAESKSRHDTKHFLFEMVVVTWL
jgi:hypothetical protein